MKIRLEEEKDYFMNENLTREAFGMYIDQVVMNIIFFIKLEQINAM